MHHHPSPLPSRPWVAGVLFVGLFLAARPGLSADKPMTGEELTKDLCQACHFFEGSEQAGTVGPPLMVMKARFPERKRLYDIIYDPQVAIKPHSMMPPFGRNALVSKEEINRIIDYLYKL